MRALEASLHTPNQEYDVRTSCSLTQTARLTLTLAYTVDRPPSRVRITTNYSYRVGRYWRPISTIAGPAHTSRAAMLGQDRLVQHPAFVFVTVTLFICAASGTVTGKDDGDEHSKAVEEAAWCSAEAARVKT